MAKKKRKCSSRQMNTAATLPLYSPPPDDLDATRGVEFIEMPVRKILNRCDSNRVPFPWTINPYRGCEFGCVYCYARYTHEYMDLDGGEFESKIFVKQDAGPWSGRELRSIAGTGEHVAIGTATDPYQPAERQFGATRA